MEKLPLLILLLYSIPESIVLLTFASTIFGYPVKENYYRIILLGVSLALMSYAIRLLPIEMGMNALIEIPLFILLTSLYLKISPVKALFYILTSFIILAIAEVIVYPTMAFVTGNTIKEIVENTPLRLITGWTDLLIITGATLFVKKKKIVMAKTPRFFELKLQNLKKTVLPLALILTQSFLAGGLILNLYAREYNIWPTVNNTTFFAISATLFITVPIVSIILLRRMFTMAEQEVINETQEAFLENMDRLFTTIRGQRHDFINHVQVLYSMLNTGKQKQAIEYMDHMLDEIQELSNIIKVKDPVLSALLNTKMAIADRHNIKLEIILKAKSAKVKLKPYIMVKILGNLIDNALEAVQEESSDKRKVSVVLECFEPRFVVKVINPAPVIGSDNIDKIFTSGFTSKKDHSGLGLALVKDLVERNRGTIEVLSNDEMGNVFTVALPVGK